MNIIFCDSLKQFLMGGTLVSGISLISNYVNPVLGGLLAGVPIGLPTIYFINNINAPSYIKNLILTTFLLFIITLVYYILYIKYNFGKNITIIYSVSIWLIAVIIIYLLQK